MGLLTLAQGGVQSGLVTWTNAEKFNFFYRVLFANIY